MRDNHERGLRILGEIRARAAPHDPEHGAACDREAQALASARGMRPVIAHAHLGLGILRWSLVQHGEGGAHLEAAASTFREMGMGPRLTQAEAALTACPA